MKVPTSYSNYGDTFLITDSYVLTHYQRSLKPYLILMLSWILITLFLYLSLEEFINCLLKISLGFLLALCHGESQKKRFLCISMILNNGRTGYCVHWSSQYSNGLSYNCTISPSPQWCSLNPLLCVRDLLKMNFPLYLLQIFLSIGFNKEMRKLVIFKILLLYRS